VRAGDVKLFVCNNDETLKVFSLPSMVLNATLRCPVPMNWVGEREREQLGTPIAEHSTHTWRRLPQGKLNAESVTLRRSMGLRYTLQFHRLLRAQARGGGPPNLDQYNG
jgi:hypothetical protein